MYQIKDDNLSLSVGISHPLKKKEAAQAEALRLFHQSLYRELRNILCEYHEGVMTLRGSVPSYYLKQVAQTLVASLESVGEINNRLEVVYS
jgi:osmotically-inducible protein OsmY